MIESMGLWDKTDRPRSRDIEEHYNTWKISPTYFAMAVHSSQQSTDAKGHLQRNFDSLLPISDLPCCTEDSIENSQDFQAARVCRVRTFHVEEVGGIVG